MNVIGRFNLMTNSVRGPLESKGHSLHNHNNCLSMVSHGGTSSYITCLMFKISIHVKKKKG